MLSVCTVIGAKVSTAVTAKKAPDFEIAAANAGLYVVKDAHSTSSYLCTRSHCFDVDWDNHKLHNYGPLVIYQDSNWDKDRVRHFLEPLNLWSDGIFGVWVFAVM